MLINILIPTKERGVKLLKCLGSIVEAKKQINDNFYVFIYFSVKEEFNIVDHLLNSYPWILPRFVDKYNSSSDFWNSCFKEHHADIYYYLNDDILLAPDCFKNSIDNMNKYFPDLDGVIGLNQENIPLNQQCKAAFGAIGTKFMERFQNKEVFCPQYKRFFLDQELYEYSSKINKFYFDESAKLIHCHPAFDKKYEDNTHFDVRKYLGRDKEMHLRRKRENLLWGESYVKV